jgi:hypothetical protein
MELSGESEKSLENLALHLWKAKFKEQENPGVKLTPAL